MHFRNISLWQITAWCLLSCQIKNPIYYNFRANLNFRPNIMTFAELHFTRDSCCPCITNTNVVDTSVAIITIAPNFPLILNFLQRIIVKVYKVSQQRMHLIKRFWRQRNTHLLHAASFQFWFLPVAARGSALPTECGRGLRWDLLLIGWGNFNWIIYFDKSLCVSTPEQIATFTPRSSHSSPLIPL